MSADIELATRNHEATHWQEGFHGEPESNSA